MRRPWPYGLSKNILKSVRALGFRVVGFRGLGSRVVTFVAGWFDSKTPRPPPRVCKAAGGANDAFGLLPGLLPQVRLLQEDLGDQGMMPTRIYGTS